MRIALLSLCIAVAVSGCGGSGDSPSSTGGVVLITIDNPWASQSEMEVFADPPPDGFVRVDDVVTVNPQARPAIVTTLSGSVPRDHGVRDNFRDAMDPGLLTVPARFREAGWRTAAFVADPRFGETAGFAPAFDLYDGRGRMVYGPERYLPWHRPAAEIVANFGSWIAARNASEPFFAWIHFAGGPLNLQHVGPRGDRHAFDSATALRTAIDEIRAALETHGVPAAVAVMAVSGPTDPADAERSGYVLHPDVIRAPMLFGAFGGAEAPPVGAGARLWTPDLAAWALAAGRLDGPEATWPPSENRIRHAAAWAGAFQFGWAPSWAVVSDGTMWAVEDPDGDPRAWSWNGGETVSDPADTAVLSALQRVAIDPAESLSAAHEVPEGLSADLDALGVMVPVAVDGPTYSGRAVRLAGAAHVLQARVHIGNRKLDEVTASYRAGLEADPHNKAARIELAEFLSLNGRYRFARQRISEVLPEDPYNVDAWHVLVHSAYIAQELPLADALGRWVEILHPDDPDILYDMACFRSLSGDLESSAEYLSRAWEAGFRNIQQIQADADLRNLRSGVEFERFMTTVAR